MNYEDITNPKELLQYMTQNIKYGFVGKNGKIYNESNIEEYNRNWYPQCIVQDGESLMKSNYGTCWDQVELERKWFDEHGYQYKTMFMWFEHKPDIIFFTNHTFLSYCENDKYYWFEHSFEANRGIHEFANEEALIETAKDKLLEYAIQIGAVTKDDRHFIKCDEYSKPESNLGVDDYIYHVTNSMNMIK